MLVMGVEETLLKFFKNLVFLLRGRLTAFKTLALSIMLTSTALFKAEVITVKMGKLYA
jgi:hypothetical protein